MNELEETFTKALFEISKIGFVPKEKAG